MGSDDYKEIIDTDMERARRLLRECGFASKPSPADLVAAYTCVLLKNQIVLMLGMLSAEEE